jgi:hypothetical protein
MKPWIPVAVGGFVVMMSFQNCSSPVQSDDLSSTPNPTQKIEELNLSQAESIHIMSSEINKEAFLDLSSGKVTRINRETGESEVRCLSESMFSAIQDVLNSSEVCEPVPRIEDSQLACAQVYTMPYARLNWIDQNVELLGEAKSACQKGADLCNNRGPVLKSLLREIQNRWPEWSCDFKEIPL